MDKRSSFCPFFIVIHFSSGPRLPGSMVSLLIFKSLFALCTDKLSVLLGFAPDKS